MLTRTVVLCLLTAACLACDTAPPERPAPVAAAPAPSPTPVQLAAAPAPTPVDDAVRNRLLGLDRPAPAPQPVAEAAPRARARRTTTFVVDDEPAAEVPSGPLSDGAFQSALGTWRGLKACLSAQTNPASDGKGALKVAFTVAQSGEVVRSQVVESTSPAARDLAPCVEREAKRVRFPAFAADEPITKEAKFVF